MTVNSPDIIISFVVGRLLGILDGIELGKCDGLGLGTGLSVGPSDLRTVGTTEGRNVGPGDLVGGALGIFEFVGKLVGEVEGLGLGIGESVGPNVAIISCRFRPLFLSLEPSIVCDTIRHVVKITVARCLILLLIIDDY